MKQLKHAPVGKAEMLIRRPVAEVFAAFVEPELLSKFWLSSSSARLEPGARLRWAFIICGAETDVEVLDLVPNERISIEWSGSERVEWRFTRRTDDQTFVSITNSGFAGDTDEVVERALDSTSGFTIVLCELKAYLEHGLRLGLGPDKFPDAALRAR